MLTLTSEARPQTIESQTPFMDNPFTMIECRGGDKGTAIPSWFLKKWFLGDNTKSVWNPVECGSLSLMSCTVNL